MQINLDLRAAPMSNDQDLRAKLCALPMVAPVRSAWPKLHLALPTKKTRQVRRSAWFTSALAAGLAFLALSISLWHNSGNEEVNTAQPAVKVTLNELMHQSQQWEEALLQLQGKSVPLDAGTALASAKIEDLIGMTDLQLSVAETPAQAESLWLRRIDLMNRLAEVRSQAAWQQAHPEQNLALINASYALN